MDSTVDKIYVGISPLWWSNRVQVVKEVDEIVATRYFERLFLSTKILRSYIYYTKLISILFLRVGTYMEPVAS